MSSDLELCDVCGAAGARMRAEAMWLCVPCSGWQFTWTLETVLSRASDFAPEHPERRRLVELADWLRTVEGTEVRRELPGRSGPDWKP